jgi:hypothetical protein
VGPNDLAGPHARSRPPGSTQVELPAGGNECFDRLRRDACHTLDAIGYAVVTVVPVQLGHGGDVLFGVRREAILESPVRHRSSGTSM